MNTFNRSLDRGIESLSLNSTAIEFLDSQRINLAAAKVPPGLDNELSNAVESAIALAFVDGFRLVALIAVGLAVASAIVALVFVNDSRQRKN